jgi:hypothetical protein
MYCVKYRHIYKGDRPSGVSELLLSVSRYGYGKRSPRRSLWLRLRLDMQVKMFLTVGITRVMYRVYYSFLQCKHLGSTM